MAASFLAARVSPPPLAILVFRIHAADQVARADRPHRTLAALVVGLEAVVVVVAHQPAPAAQVHRA
jgi:hypothetical protein